MEKNKEICGFCKHGKHYFMEMSDCTKNPPTVVAVINNENDLKPKTVWPQVNPEEDWCDNWEESTNSNYKKNYTKQVENAQLIKVEKYGDGLKPIESFKHLCPNENGSCQSRSGGSCCSSYYGFLQNEDFKDYIVCLEGE